jgi:uncharacterized protein DUF4386
MHPTDKAARIAGAIYVSMLFVGPFSLIYVPTKLIARGNATATAANILSHEMLFRFGIVADMIGSVIFIYLAMALYRLFRGVNATRATQLVGLVLVSAAAGFVNTLNNIAALTLFRGADFLAAIPKPQRDVLGMFFIRLARQGITINELFWGLWLFPFGLLVIESRFFPRILGWLLIVNGLAYVAISITSILLPAYANVMSRYAFPFELGELWMMFWLLIKGARAESLKVPEPQFTV